MPSVVRININSQCHNLREPGASNKFTLTKTNCIHSVILGLSNGTVQYKSLSAKEICSQYWSLLSDAEKEHFVYARKWPYNWVCGCCV